MIKQAFQVLAAALLALTLTACDPHDWNDPNRYDTPDSWSKRPSTETDCVAAGGAMTLVCAGQDTQCVRPFPDAGKTCTTNDDCTGACLVDLTGEELETGEASAIGICQADDTPCGTFIKIEDGIVQEPIVVE